MHGCGADVWIWRIKKRVGGGGWCMVSGISVEGLVSVKCMGVEEKLYFHYIFFGSTQKNENAPMEATLETDQRYTNQLLTDQNLARVYRLSLT